MTARPARQRAQRRNWNDDRQNILPRALERLSVIEAEAPVKDAAALMSRPHTDLIVVCEHGDIVGVLTKTDIVGQISRGMGAG